MRYIKAYIGLKVVCLGIWIYERRPFGFLTEEDKLALMKLWVLHDRFSREIEKEAK